MRKPPLMHADTESPRTPVDQAVPPRADVRRSRVEASTLVPGVGGKNIGPGQLVDLDELVGHGLSVRDLFPLDWFEAADEPPVTPAPTTARAKE